MWKPRISIRARWLCLAAGIGVLVAAAYGVAFLRDEPLRRSIEREMNANLKGYTVRLGAASFHPHGFSIDLKDLTVIQDANPDPPVMRIARLGASVQWRALLHRRVVASMLLERPSVYVNLAHLKQEAAEQVPIKQRGWQDALQAAYPLKINEIDVKDGDVTYVDPSQPFKPLRLSQLNASIENIRNIKSQERVYPSELHLKTVVFDTGRLSIDGNADFLAEPIPGILGRFSLEQMQIDYFRPITRRYNVVITGGTLSTTGQFEYAPAIASAVLEDVTLRGAQLEYVHTPRTAQAEQEVAAKTAETAKKVTDRPDIKLAIGRLDIIGSTIGFVNKAADPPYRVFFTNTDLHLTGLSNQSAQGQARAALRGKFMGSGTAEVVAAFRPDQKGGDLELKVAVNDTDMAALNDLLRAYGKFDVAGGRFSLYSETSVRNGDISGYVKPIFKDVVAYHPEQDRDKTFGQKLKKRVLGGVAKILENRSRGEVATKADLSGRLEKPETSTWQIVRRLIQNAFFKAILPGFDESVGRGERPPSGPSVGRPTKPSGNPSG